MKQMIRLAAFLFFLTCGSTFGGDAVMRTESWPHGTEGFAEYEKRIAHLHPRNLLAREGARMEKTTAVSYGAAEMLFDGTAGVYVSTGRVLPSGKPAIMTFYLGGPKTIRQVGVFTSNSDSRVNQDFEVRFANNAALPGQAPMFPAEPDLTSGPLVLGKNRGGFHTCFRANDGGNLTAEPVDWVQFRIWPTLGINAGKAGKGKTRDRGPASLVELEVLGDEPGPNWAAEDTYFRNIAKLQQILEQGYRKQNTWQDTLALALENVEKSLPGSEDAERLVWDRLMKDFDDESSKQEITRERADGIWKNSRKARDVKSLAQRYAKACRKHDALYREATTLAKTVTDRAGLKKVRSLYERSHRLREAEEAYRPVNWDMLRLAVEDLTATFGDRYPRGEEFLRRIEEARGLLDAGASAKTAVTEEDVRRFERACRDTSGLQREALLANPLINFDELLIVRRKEQQLGMPANWQSNSSVPKAGYDNEIARMSISQPGQALKTVFRPGNGEFVGDVDIHFNADRLLFSMPSGDGRGPWHVHEINPDGSGLRVVTEKMDPTANNYDACYMPDGRIVYTSTAGMVAVPCVRGNSLVATLFRMDADGSGARQLCFDQEHSWCPTVMNDGRILYSRWEYADLPHSNSRMLFTSNPDGTNQRAYYGSNSFWPNSIFYARPIPGHPTMVVGTITGHHAPKRMGELILFDPALGTEEADGVVQRIPGYGEKVEPIIRDGLTGGSWPKFLHPYPLSRHHFLVSMKPSSREPWGIYLVDVFDNLVLIREEANYALLEPLPLRKTPTPPVMPDRFQPNRKDATMLISDIYTGPGLEGIPRGEVKSLRLYSFTFGYPGVGGLYGSIGADGPWDMRRILGTAPVARDGSAVVRIPANTPIAIQPLDSDGKALQLMRSWMTAMPGETLSCIGCHEKLNDAPPAAKTADLRRKPSEITPWYGPQRNYEFQRELQPVIDRYCVGCHDGEKDDPDLRGTVMLTGWKSVHPGNTGVGSGGKFSIAYANLHRYVRRPGIESPMPLQVPMEFHADTTELVQLLLKGHYNVKLDAEAWDRLVTWIDYNAPYHGRWSTIVGDSAKGKEDHRANLRYCYANVEENHEYLPEMAPDPVKPLVPEPEPPRPAVLTMKGWPFKAAPVKEPVSVDLGNGTVMEMVFVPPGEFPMGSVTGYTDEFPMTRIRIDRGFWMSKFEITNRQFGEFNSNHDSREEDRHGYQFGIPGYAVNGPELPAVRLSWKQAVAFCEWLSGKTGRNVTLPTEAQWEYACRAGTDTPFSYGGLNTDFSKYANLGDASLADFAGNPYQIDRVKGRYDNANNPHDNWIPQDRRFNDGGFVSESIGKYLPNAWGLHDMHGNVAEWTASVYKPYPYTEPTVNDSGKRVVRGGSWYDRPKRSTSSFRFGYREYQKVFNVGFRVVMAD